MATLSILTAFDAYPDGAFVRFEAGEEVEIGAEITRAGSMVTAVTEEVANLYVAKGLAAKEAEAAAETAAAEPEATAGATTEEPTTGAE